MCCVYELDTIIPYLLPVLCAQVYVCALWDWEGGGNNVCTVLSQAKCSSKIEGVHTHLYTYMCSHGVNNMC